MGEEQLFYFEKLNVWRAARTLANHIYQLTDKFPTQERYGLTDQLRRAAVSVASNLAESSGRNGIKERLHFLQFSYGSLMEIRCQLLIAQDLGIIEHEKVIEVSQIIVEIAKMISGLRHAISNSPHNIVTEPEMEYSNPNNTPTSSSSALHSPLSPPDLSSSALHSPLSTKTPRIGHGFDVHRFAEGRELWLCGVKVPCERGLLGHSDADVALHALCDALLGAAALRDIGYHFPDTDPKYKGADSRVLLRRVAELVAEKGYGIGNVDVTIIAQAPKLLPYIEQMRQTVASDLGIDLDCVSVKATTTERLGFTGRGEGIAAQAVALII